MHSVVQLCESRGRMSGLLVVIPNSSSGFPFLSFLLFFPVHGVRDLFWLPIEQYRKDGRIIRGLQRGAASFGTSTASAALELSNRLVQAIQVGLAGSTWDQNLSPLGLSRGSLRSSRFCVLLQATAEMVYDILSPTPPLNRFTITEGRAPSSRPRRAAQPADLREGVAKAYDTVREVRASSVGAPEPLVRASSNMPLLPPGSDRHGSDPVRCSVPRPRAEGSPRGGGRRPPADPAHRGPSFDCGL